MIASFAILACLSKSRAEFLLSNVCGITVLTMNWRAFVSFCLLWVVRFHRVNGWVFILWCDFFHLLFHCLGATTNIHA